MRPPDSLCQYHSNPSEIMKASLKMREGDIPLMKAKLPLNLLGLSLFSGITFGNTQELALRLGTFTEVGPCWEVSYRPNDVDCPLTLVMKTGSGKWGSSSRSSLSMAAEFNLLNGGGPRFRLWLKPQAGDFSLRKDFSSSDNTTDDQFKASLPLEFHSDHERNVFRYRKRDEELANTPASSKKGARGSVFQNATNSSFSPRHIDRGTGYATSFVNDGFDVDWEHVGDMNSYSRPSSHVDSISQHSGEGEEPGLQRQPVGSGHVVQGVGMCGLLAGTRLRARSIIPIFKQAQLQIRWRMQLPSNFSQNLVDCFRASTFRPPFLPFLVMDKISVERTNFPRNEGPEFLNTPSPLKFCVFEEDQKLAQLEAICSSMKDSLHSIQLENRDLKRAMENMRVEVGARSSMTAQEEKPIVEIPTDEDDVLQPQLFQDFLERKRLLS